MKYLLDSHALLWALSNPNALSPEARHILTNPRSNIAVSAATIWELGIKSALGKLTMPNDLVPRVRTLGLDFLDITADHATTAATLPPHHKDPFDRMLVAQALTDSRLLITRDQHLAAYGVGIILC